MGNKDCTPQEAPDWLGTWHLCLLSFLPFIAILSFRNIVTLAALMAIAIWCDAASRKHLYRLISLQNPFAMRPVFSLLRPTSPVAGMCLWGGVLWGWMGLSCVWAPDKAAAVEWLTKGFFFAGTIFTLLTFAGQVGKKWAEHLMTCIALCVIITSVALVIEASSGGIIRDIFPPFEENPIKDIVSAGRGCTVILGFMPALAVWVWLAKPSVRRWYVTVWCGVFCALVYAASALLVDANLLAIMAGIGSVLLSAFLPIRFVMAALVVGIFVSLLGMPVLALVLPTGQSLQILEGLPLSWLHRVVIWQHTAELVFSNWVRFLFGFGIDASDYLSVALARQSDAALENLPGSTYRFLKFSSHPHNVFLHIWLEFGLVGVLCFTGLIWQAVRWLRQKAQIAIIVRAGLAVAGAALVYAHVEVSLWNFWRLMVPVFAVFTLILVYVARECRLPYTGRTDFSS